MHDVKNRNQEYHEICYVTFLEMSETDYHDVTKNLTFSRMLFSMFASQMRRVRFGHPMMHGGHASFAAMQNSRYDCQEVHVRVSTGPTTLRAQSFAWEATYFVWRDQVSLCKTEIVLHASKKRIDKTSKTT